MPDISRWTLLDVLRGLAALTVVFWHWQIFWAGPDGKLPPLQLLSPSFPFYAIFWPLYHYGSIAVNLFFVLSGFVFFWKYETAIARGEISTGQFFLLRFARLYPLHFLTLITIAALQLTFVAVKGYPFVYTHDDLYHFGLNLVMAQGWGLKSDYSFNGPSWSVSIEVALYALFFLVSSVGATRLWHLILMCLIGAAAVSSGQAFNLSMGVMGFFAGAIAFRAVAFALARNWRVPFLISACSLVVGMIVMVMVRHNYIWLVLAASLIAFPSLIFLLAILEKKVSGGAYLAWLGDISYSSYMLHVPLQLIASLLAFYTFGAQGTGLFLSPVFFLAFFGVLVSISLAMHHFFERPAQRAILSHFRKWSAVPVPA